MSDYSASVYREQGGSALRFADGGEYRYDPQIETTAANLDRAGMSVVGTTAVIALFNLDAPVAGVHKLIYCSSASSTGWVDVYAGAAVQYGETAANRYLRFNAAEEAVQLYGLSTAKWAILANVGAVAATTSTT